MQATSGSIIGRMGNVADGKPILVVEDERNIASLLKLYLSNEGFSVACVADGMATMNAPPGIPGPLMPWLTSARLKCPADAVIVLPDTAAVVVTWRAAPRCHTASGKSSVL